VFESVFQRGQDDKNGKVERKCFRCGDLNRLIGDGPKQRRNNYQRDFVREAWSDSEEDKEENTKDKTCLMAETPNEVQDITQKDKNEAKRTKPGTGMERV
nr:zf-CCHC domain-containing protein/UBN2 domain-containing protein [Tanacetum cinerariifolium]